MHRVIPAAAVVFSLTSLAASSSAQTTMDYPRGEMIPVALATPIGLNSATIKPGEPVFGEQLVVPESAWLRVYFDGVQLSPGSFIRITSALDGESQDLDAEALALWENTSAFFNGDTLAVELFLAAGADPAANHFSIAQVLRERGNAQSPEQFCGICGPDDRFPSNQPWAGRMMPVGCTGTIYDPNSCIVSAGHCVSSGLVIQFNVPSSNSDCSLRNPPVEDQFPITNFLYENAGVGNDWSVLTTGPNNVGQKIYDRYGVTIPIAYAPAKRDDTANVWGYAIDDECTRTQTQQDSNGGPILGAGETNYSFNIDITFGNSGSSLIRNGEIIGIVTHCSTGCQNYGTRIDAPDFVAARQTLCDDIDRSLRLNNLVPGLAGQRNSITAEGCKPGEMVDFYYGRGMNFTPVPGCPNIMLDILNPILAASVPAAADGTATISGTIPGRLSGSSLTFQVVTPETCRVTEFVVARFP